MPRASVLLSLVGMTAIGALTSCVSPDAYIAVRKPTGPSLVRVFAGMMSDGSNIMLRVRNVSDSLVLVEVPELGLEYSVEDFETGCLKRTFDLGVRSDAWESTILALPVGQTLPLTITMQPQAIQAVRSDSNSVISVCIRAVAAFECQDADVLEFSKISELRKEYFTIDRRAGLSKPAKRFVWAGRLRASQLRQLRREGMDIGPE